MVRNWNLRRAQIFGAVIVAAIAAGLGLSAILAPRQEPTGAVVVLSRNDDYATRHALHGRPITALTRQDDYWTRNNTALPLGRNDDYATRGSIVSIEAGDQHDEMLPNSGR